MENKKAARKTTCLWVDVWSEHGRRLRARLVNWSFGPLGEHGHSLAYGRVFVKGLF